MQVTLEIDSQESLQKLLAYIEGTDIRVAPTLPTSKLTGEAKKRTLEWIKNYKSEDSNSLDVWNEYLKEVRNDRPLEGRN
jgi:hypothetical protein